MKTLVEALPWVQIVLSVLLIVSVMLQQSEAGAGGAFGFDSGVSNFHTKRGVEKALFIATIVLGILFFATSVTALLLK